MYKACPQGWSGGVGSKSNSQVSDEVTVLVYKIATETVATKPADRKRTNLGVGEEVSLTFKPSAVSVSWSVENSKGSIFPASGATATYTAHDEAATANVKADFKGVSETTVFTVVEPAGETATKTDLSWPAGVQGAGMDIVVTTTPTDVSFSNVEVLEVDKGTSNVTGYFQQPPSSALTHQPNTSWVKLNDENKWEDAAAFYSWPSPWYAGTYQWDIDVHWRVVGGSGAGKKFATRTQLHTINGNTGSSTESKLGVSATRSP